MRPPGTHPEQAPVSSVLHIASARFKKTRRHDDLITSISFTLSCQMLGGTEMKALLLVVSRGRGSFLFHRAGNRREHESRAIVQRSRTPTDLRSVDDINIRSSLCCPSNCIQAAANRASTLQKSASKRVLDAPKVPHHVSTGRWLFWPMEKALLSEANLPLARLWRRSLVDAPEALVLPELSPHATIFTSQYLFRVPSDTALPCLLQTL